MKSLWESKTFWVNVVAIVAMVAQAVTGANVLPAEYQVAALGVVNVILRVITKKEIAW